MAEIFINNMCFRIFHNPSRQRDEVSVYDYLGSDTIIRIPEQVDGYVVSGIGKWAFEKTGVEEVYYPDCLTCIEDGAFLDCHKLKTVESYPSSHTAESLDVMPFAFNRCSQLTTFQSIIPVCVWYQAFQNCISLNKVSATISGFGDKAFYGSLITELHFSDDVLWGKGAYDGMKNLRDLYFEGRVSEQTCKSYLKYIRRKRLHVDVNKFNHMELAYDGTEILM